MRFEIRVCLVSAILSSSLRVGAAWDASACNTSPAEAVAIAKQLFVSYDVGSCEVYPEEGGYCSSLGLGGKSVYMSARTKALFSTIDQFMYCWLEKMGKGAQSLTVSECSDLFRVMACNSLFPQCTSDGVPRKQCVSSCQALQGYCANAFQYSRIVGAGAYLPTCDQTYGFAVNYFLSMPPSFWLGETGYESETYVDDAFNNTEVSCIDSQTIASTEVCEVEKCAEPMVERRYPLLKDPTQASLEFQNPEDAEYCSDTSIDLDCSRCFSTCELPCPYPGVFTTSFMNQLWIFQWLPGIIALPMSLVVAYTEEKKVRKHKVRTLSDRLILIAALLCVAISFVDSIPSMFLKEDMRCAGSLTYTTYKGGDDPNGHDFCILGKFRFQVLQALLFTVGCMLYRVHHQLAASQKMQKYKPSKKIRVIFTMLIFGVPGLSALLTILLKGSPLMHANRNYRIAEFTQEYLDQGYNSTMALTLAGKKSQEFISLTVANNMRYMYSCGPYFDTTVAEFVIIYVPLIIAGLGSSFLAIVMLKTVNHVATSVRVDKTKLNERNPALYRLAINMLRFAFATIFLAILNILATSLYLPQAESLGQQTFQYTRCLSNGISQEVMAQAEAGEAVNILLAVDIDTSLNASLTRCGLPSSVAPETSTLFLLVISQSFPALAFALVFFLPALRTIRQNRAATTRVGGTTNPSTGSVKSSGE